MPSYRLLTLTLLLCLLSGCDHAQEQRTPPIEISASPAPLNVPQPLRLGEIEILAEIALHPSEQSTGLMYRESMPENHGMLFVYPRPQRMSFWMKNTLIPLDIGFFDSKGILTEVLRMYPKDLSAKPSASDQIQFALEMNQGWFAEKKILPGALLDLNTLRRAIAARGVDPADFGL